ncbi:unnamed protein product [Urochloa decumbens]|uniref:E3 ubiquitin-protein ligase PRT1 n=1 Tax=Urochloa decumbens TaxID=240449 RepID=A0ABC9CJA4_9POAL
MASDGHPPEPGKMEEVAATASGHAASDLDDPQFMCCVCLDLLYKPVVISCGHMSCFWCVQRAMHTFHESHCAVCRQPYKHFPSICQLMHHLLLKLEPAEYKRREKEILEEEKRIEMYSPQIIEFLNSKNSEVGSDEEFRNEDNKTGPPQEVSLNDSIVDDHSKKIKLEDVSCPLCKEMLYQPAVLNCGHVYCVSCLSSLNEEALRCHVCGSLHPGDFPNVCLDLDHFLEEYFPVEYESRVQKVQSKKGQFNPEGSSSGTSSAKGSSSAQHADILDIHISIGCDSCGVFPIRGERYKCRDCTELIGFDLCGTCYKSGSKLPRRFNQQHTPDHRMELDNSSLLQSLLRVRGEELHALVATGGMVQIFFGNQGIEGNDVGQGEAAMEEPVGAPGDMLHIVDNDQEMEDSGEEADQEA